MQKTLFLMLCFPVFALAGVNKCVNDGKVVYSEASCLSGAVVYDAKRASIADDSVRSVSVVRGADGVFSVSGFVNGSRADFILDTGCSKTSLSGEMAYRLGLRTCVPVSMASTANGLSSLCRITVSSLSFAGLNLSNVTVDVSPNMRGASLIGNDLLNHFTVVQRSGVMTLSR